MRVGKLKRARFRVENAVDGAALDDVALGMLKLAGGHAIRMPKYFAPHTPSWNVYFDRSLSERERLTLRGAGYRYIGNRWYRSDAVARDEVTRHALAN